MNEDDPIHESRSPTPRALDRLGVAELQAYVASLQAEIVRVESEIARKRAVLNAAQGFFRAP